MANAISSELDPRFAEVKELGELARGKIVSFASAHCLWISEGGSALGFALPNILPVGATSSFDAALKFTFHRYQRSRVSPPVYLGVSVRVGHHSATRMSPCRQVRPPFQILVPVNIEETYGQRVFMNIDEHEQLGSASLGEFFPTEKRGRCAGTSIVEGSRSHIAIHGVTAHAWVGFAISQLGLRAISWTFENLVSFHLRSQRSFALSVHVINVGAVWFTVMALT